MRLLQCERKKMSCLMAGGRPRDSYTLWWASASLRAAASAAADGLIGSPAGRVPVCADDCDPDNAAEKQRVKAAEPDVGLESR